uniref:Macaca fascicularis brain cDNA clone: QflA-13163, similar to human sorting nexin family member 27 (SNX27), mRNA, RefSeq: NM_030918.4 n=1 Tax=Macaca fascicularis TaxID=9541 RepID=I7GKG5_MACFA|nr:unnamed protein product [Macaca fascicularis]
MFVDYRSIFFNMLHKYLFILFKCTEFTLILTSWAIFPGTLNSQAIFLLQPSE